MGDISEISDDGDIRLPAGTRLGKYAIIRMLGAGGMGAVYEAAHVEIGKHVAVKVLGPAVAAIPGARARFLREAQLTTRVRHPNIVDVTDMGNENGQTYLVMELLRGEDLAQRLTRTGPIPTRDLADIMLPVCAAVVAAHQAGVTHRDLKPQNIFLSTNQNSLHPKVLDFGISKGNDAGGAGTLTSTGAMIGTPFYLAPEQILDNRSAGPASDQYSLGVILYEALTGLRPFDADNLFVVFQSIVAGNPRRPRELRPEIPAEMEDVVLRAMNLNPKSRFTTTAELGRALLRFASERHRLIWENAFTDMGTDSRSVPQQGPLGLDTPYPRAATTTPLPPAFGLTTPLPPASFPPAGMGRVANAGSGDPWTTGATPARPSSSVSGTRVMPRVPVQTPVPDVSHREGVPDFRPKSRRGRWIFIVGLGAAGIVAVAGAIRYLGGGAAPTTTNRSDTAAPPTRASGELPTPQAAPPTRRLPTEPDSFRVSLTTDPDNATVELDGTVVGSGSVERKMLIDHVPHTLRVSADGFEARTVEFTDAPPPGRIALVRRTAPPAPAPENAANGAAPAAPAAPPVVADRPTHRRRSRSARASAGGSSSRGSDGRASAPPEGDAPHGLNPNGAPIID